MLFGVRRSQPGRRCRHLAVGRLAPRRRVRDDAFGHGDLAHRHLPLVGCRLQQHHARHGTPATHVVFGGPDAAAAAGSHFTPYALASVILPGGGRFGRHVLPVAFEFFGHELRQAGQRALPHFRSRDAQHAGLVRANDYPRIDFGHARRVLRCGVCLATVDVEGQLHSERETAAGGRGTDDEFAPRKIRRAGCRPACSRFLHGHPPTPSTGPWVAGPASLPSRSPPPYAPRRECAGTSRSGRYWSSPRRCPCPSASGSS